MVEVILVIVAVFCWVPGVYYWVHRDAIRDKLKKNRTNDFIAAHEEWKTDKELWDLLKDDDPAWLTAMGIEEPEVYRKERERKQKLKQHFAEVKEQNARHKLAGLKPMTAMAQAGGTFDRGVEARLEEGLLRNSITPETLADMSDGEKEYARRVVMARLHGRDAEAQHFLDLQGREQERRLRARRQAQKAQGTFGSVLGGVGAEIFLGAFGRRKH